MCMCMGVWIRVCECICVSICVYIYMCVYTYICSHAHRRCREVKQKIHTFTYVLTHLPPWGDPWGTPWGPSGASAPPNPWVVRHLPCLAGPWGPCARRVSLRLARCARRVGVGGWSDRVASYAFSHPPFFSSNMGPLMWPLNRETVRVHECGPRPRLCGMRPCGLPATTPI